MTYRRTAFIQLPDPGLDCPGCQGWIKLFGSAIDRKPVYFQCSNKNSDKPQLKCDMSFMFSRKITNCSACSKEIRINDIICTCWDHTWVHLRCYGLKEKPKGVLAVCLRCEKPIADSAPSVASSCGSVAGFLHQHCQNKRHREVDDDKGNKLLELSETDKEFGSQDTEEGLEESA